MSSEGQHLDVVQRYLKIINLIEDVDKTLNTLDERQSDVDLKLSDLEHFAENYKKSGKKPLTGKQALEFFDLLGDIRQIRRDYKMEWEIKQFINQERNKLGYTNQYEWFKHNICKAEKDLFTTYKPRIWSDDDILGMITKAGGRGRKPNNVKEKV